MNIVQTIQEAFDERDSLRKQAADLLSERMALKGEVKTLSERLDKQGLAKAQHESEIATLRAANQAFGDAHRKISGEATRLRAECEATATHSESLTLEIRRLKEEIKKSHDRLIADVDAHKHWNEAETKLAEAKALLKEFCNIYMINSDHKSRIDALLADKPVEHPNPMIAESNKLIDQNIWLNAKLVAARALLRDIRDHGGPSPFDMERVKTLLADKPVKPEPAQQRHDCCKYCGKSIVQEPGNDKWYHKQGSSILCSVAEPKDAPKRKLFKASIENARDSSINTGARIQSVCNAIELLADWVEQKAAK